MRFLLTLVISTVPLGRPVSAQVTIEPSRIAPAAWERIALRVFNTSDTGITSVQLDVPEALTILGVEQPHGWMFDRIHATDSTPPTIVWYGDSLGRGEFTEFALLARLAGDARRKELVFPVRLTRTTGTMLEWSRYGEGGAPPTMQIVGTTSVTPWGALGLASVALGVAVLALGIAMSNRNRMG